MSLFLNLFLNLAMGLEVARTKNGKGSSSWSYMHQVKSSRL